MAVVTAVVVTAVVVVAAGVVVVPFMAVAVAVAVMVTTSVMTVVVVPRTMVTVTVRAGAPSGGAVGEEHLLPLDSDGLGLPLLPAEAQHIVADSSVHLILVVIGQRSVARPEAQERHG